MRFPYSFVYLLRINVIGMNKIERLSGILIKLQSRKVVAAPEIADEYQVSLRTIYRDLRILEHSGVPIIAIPGVGYSLVEGYRLPPLMFTPDEAISFLMAERLLGGQADESTYLIYKSGMDKIRAALKTTERDLLENFGESVGSIQHKDAIQSEGSPHVLKPLLKGIRERRRVVIDYKTFTKQASVREIEPIGLYFMSNQWYLLAWCHLRRDYRTFKLTRIGSVMSLEHPFAQNHPPLKALLDKMYAVEVVYHITIKIEKEAMPLTGGNRYHRLMEEKECGDYCICRYATFSKELFARWFLSFADKAEIIEPVEMKELVRELIRSIAQSQK